MRNRGLYHGPESGIFRGVMAERRLCYMILAITGIALVSAAGCAPPVASGGFDAPDPASRLYAIARAARTDDQSAVPLIIPSLDADDPAERMMAIEALHRLTGERLGYRHDDPRELREAAVDRWIRFVSEP